MPKHEDVFTRDGRIILKNGKKFVYVGKEEGASPTDADCVADLLLEVLNNCDFPKIKKIYMGK